MKLIVEIEMPTGCANCPMGDDDSRFCKAAKKYIPMLGKPSWCPIKGELPDEHGDLIDRDELLKRKGNCYDADGHLLYAVGTGEILQIKPIIAAERKDDEQIH